MPPFNESTFFCFSQFGCSCIKRPIDDYVLGPYVELDFTGQGGTTLKVGNKSNPPKNTAVIKSFQYGQSDGVGAEVEVYDEEGGAFQRFVDKIARTPGEALTLYKARGRWGWIMQNCDGTTRQVLSRYHWFAILSVDINFAGKGIIFKLELQDLMEPLFETRINKSYDDLTLKAAIQQMFRESNPPINDVRFLRFKNNGGGLATICQTGNSESQDPGSIEVVESNLEELKFNGDAETRTARWQCNNQTPLAAAREWVSRYRSERDDKGVIVFYDNKTPQPRLIFLEDPLPKCFTNDTQCNRSIGTYIVNGGRHSPVLSFDPKIKFNFSAAARAGASVSSESGRAEVQRGQPCPNNRGGATPGAGSASMIQVTEDMNRLYGRNEAAREGNVSQAGNERANKTFENIEAELKIQGEPRLDDPFAIRIRTVSIIVVNPFHLAQGRDTCPDWLVRPPCNPILSNKNWFMNGVSHEIKEGSYTTTIKLFLPAPGDSVTP
jgi:hypothetical protein